MKGKRKPSQGAKPARVREGREDRADQPQRQYNHTARNLKQPLTDKQLQRVLIDMWCSFSGGLLQPKFSYYVGSDGRLMTRAERRGAK